MHAEVLRAIMPDETAKQRKRLFPTLRTGIFFLPHLVLGVLTSKVFQMALSRLSPLPFLALMLLKIPKCIPLPSPDSSPELFTQHLLEVQWASHSQHAHNTTPLSSRTQARPAPSQASLYQRLASLSFLRPGQKLLELFLNPSSNWGRKSY